MTIRCRRRPRNVEILCFVSLSSAEKKKKQAAPGTDRRVDACAKDGIEDGWQNATVGSMNQINLSGQHELKATLRGAKGGYKDARRIEGATRGNSESECII